LHFFNIWQADKKKVQRMKRLLLFITLVSLLACAGCSTEAVSPSQVTIPTSTANTDLSGETKTDDTKADNDKTSKKDDSVFEIREKMFIAQCNDIYLNLKDFEGRTVKIEGFCDTDIDPETGKTYYGVIRKGPGCCGNDGVQVSNLPMVGNIQSKMIGSK